MKRTLILYASINVVLFIGYGFLIGGYGSLMALPLVLALSIAAGLMTYAKLRKTVVSVETILTGIKAALLDEMQTAGDLLGKEASRDTRKFLISAFKDEVNRIQQNRNRQAPPSIDHQTLLSGVQHIISGNQHLADEDLSIELANSIRDLLLISDAGKTAQKNHHEAGGTNELKFQFLIADLNNLVTSITDNSRNASKANQVAYKAKDIASENQGVVENAMDSMVAISKASEAVGGIIKSINNIAFQTNLLALNASVEAARVGKAGAGFAVVAQEVRSLAQEATTAAQLTEESIIEITSLVASAKTQVDQTTAAFVDLAEKAGTIGQVVEKIQKDTSRQGHEADRIHISILQMLSKQRDESGSLEGTGGFESHQSANLLLPRTFKIQTHWLPQSQFAGYYMALEMDLYRKYGVKVELLDGGPDSNSLFQLIKGDINFSTAWLSSALTTVDRGAELKLLAQIFEVSGLMLLCLKELNITKIEDLRHKSVSTWGGFLAYPVMALDMDHSLELHLLEDGVDVEKILQREIDAVAVMSYNEIFSFYDRGLKASDLTIFRMSDIGYNFPEDGLYTNRSTAENDPEVCKIVKQASIEGWQAVKRDTESALDIVMRHHERSAMKTDRRHQERMLTEVMKLIGISSEISGFLGQDDFNRTVDALLRIGLVREKVSYQHFFLTNL